MSISLTTPVGRIVQGELWKGREVTDNKGVVKIGTDGKPQMSWYFAQAIPKTPGCTHWAQEKYTNWKGEVVEWGRLIWDEGNRAHPNFAPHPTFSWKIEDGDSVIPNKKGKRNCDREGHAGHWILKFSTQLPITRTYNADGTAPLPPEAFKPGNFVQVNLTVKGNTGETPGIYLNPYMVALSGYGPEIVSGPDVAEAGFGGQPLPAGAQAVPVSVALPTLPAPTLPVAPSALPPTLPGAPVHPVAVAPNPAFLAGPPAAPPAPVGPQMTAKAGGFTRDQYVAQGWTDAQLREQGMMV